MVMNQFHDRFRLVATLSAVLIAAAIGCQQQDSQGITARNSGFMPAGDDSSTSDLELGGDLDPTSSIPVQPAPLRELGAGSVVTDSFEVPDGTAEELLQFIQELGNVLRQELSVGGGNEQVLSIMDAQLRAAEKILGKRTSTDIRNQAVERKLESLRMLAIYDPLGSRDSFHDYALSLIEEDDPTLASMGKVALFQLHVDEFSRGEVSDVEGIIQELQALVNAKGAGPSEFITARHAAVTLGRLGHIQETVTALNIIGNAFLNHSRTDTGRRSQGIVGRGSADDVPRPN